MSRETLTREELEGAIDVSDVRLRRFERRELRRDNDAEWEFGQYLIGELIDRLAAEDRQKHLVTIRRLRILKFVGGGRVFLAVVAKVSGITLADGNWADFLKRLIEWLMSEEGQAFIKMIIDLIMLIIGLFSGL